MPRLLEVATCVAERYPSLRIFCETNARVTRRPYPFSQRSHVCNLRQTLQGKGEKIRGWKPQVSTLLCPRRVGALPAAGRGESPRSAERNSPLRFSEKLPARQGRTRLRSSRPPLSRCRKTPTRFASPGQPVPKKPPARFASPVALCRENEKGTAHAVPLPSVDMSAAQQQQLPQLPQPPQVLSPQVPQEPQPPLP